MLAVLLAGGAVPAKAAAPAVVVSPALSQEDGQVAFRVRGLAPHARVSLTIRSTDAKGYAWRLTRRYSADARGELDVRDGAPLLVTMRPTRRDPWISYYWSDHAPSVFTLSVSANGRALARASFRRAWSLRPLTRRRETVRSAGFYGVYITPRGATKRPGVLAFGGSEGGLGTSALAARLAAHGFPTLAIAYFKAPGVPQRLVDIPLEYFRHALQWLERQPEVDPARTAVLGISRGSEAALLLGVHYPRLVHGVFALVPSSVVNCGIGDYLHPGCIGAAWTLGGRPLPYTRDFDNPAPADVPAAIIPVERIEAPVFLACGDVDSVWASCPFSHAIAKRLTSRHELHEYALGGHFLGSLLPYEPGSTTTDLDGPADERAREDLWPRALAFLRSL